VKVGNIHRRNPEYPDLDGYDHFLVGYSGGKDSTACVLYLLEEGVLPEKIELWHHCIDGREGSGLMDWPVTEDYCRAFADALGLSLFYSWRVGGFEREMLRENQKTAPVRFETLDSTEERGGTGGKLGTRRKFPQVSANLSVRWCSSALKIDVMSIAINNQTRFQGKRTLVITGERAEESAARSKYKTFEPHRCHRDGRIKRHVDHWRPIHAWLEADVWAIAERFKVRPHPAYYLGWGRLSCAACIFGSSNQWASLRQVNPGQFDRIAAYEKEFDCTIHRTQTVCERGSLGAPYEAVKDRALIAEALADTYPEQIIVETWELPAGAFGESCGPT